MEERNIRSTNQMINLEHDQQAQFHIHPEPYVLSGSVSNYPQPSMNRVLPVPVPIAGFVPAVGSGESSLPFGMTHYNAVHHHPVAGNMVPAAPSNYYNAYMSQPSSSVNPPQIYQGPQFVDGFGGAYKSKSAEGYFGSYQYGNSVAGPSSMVPLTMEVGSQRSVRTGPVGGENFMVHNPSLLIQGNYQGQVLVPANAPWLDQRVFTNGGIGGTWASNQAPAVPYIHGAGNIVPERFQETAVHRSATNFQHYPPPVYPQGHLASIHHQLQPMHGALYPQVPPPSNRPPRLSSSSHTNVGPFQAGNQVGNQVGMEVAPVFLGHSLPPGLGVYHPTQGRAIMPGIAMRHHALPHLSLLSADEIAMLDIPRFYEMGNATDNHRDMRMDVDNMTYEELLALEEHIGSVGTGLSENAISSQLETRTHSSSTTTADNDDQETDFCTICQMNYENEEKIGILDCGHEYHVDCVKRWLVLKNICPICKSSALTTKRTESAREG